MAPQAAATNKGAPEQLPKKGGTGRFTTYGFAVGSVYRRARDWFDWMLPEAWNVEHNNLHHYRLSESGARGAHRAAPAPSL